MEANKTTALGWIKQHKIISLIILALVLIFGLRLGSFIITTLNPEENQTLPVSVKVEEAQLRDMSLSMPLTGRISPNQEVAIIPMAQGQITGVYAKVGDFVKAGTILFEIDKTQNSVTYNQARAGYDLAKSSYDNLKVLYEEGAISKMDHDKAYNSYVNAREGLNAAGELLSYCTVTSPIDGYITSLNAVVGNMASPGIMGSVADTSSLKIESAVSQHLAGKIQLGQKVDIAVSSLGDTIYQGTVTAFSPAPALGTLTYPITIAIDPGQETLMAGMFAEARFKVEDSLETLALPSGAIITKNGEPTVITVDDNSLPSFKKVELGIDDGTYTQIKTGITKGEKVVVSGQNFVTEGVKVNII